MHNQIYRFVLYIYFRGFVALGKNQFSDAQQLFKEAVQKDPTNAVVSHFVTFKCIHCWPVDTDQFRLHSPKSRVKFC